MRSSFVKHVSMNEVACQSVAEKGGKTRKIPSIEERRKQEWYACRKSKKIIKYSREKGRKREKEERGREREREREAE